KHHQNPEFSLDCQQNVDDVKNGQCVASDEILNCCTMGKTQNPNESLHSYHSDTVVKCK
ncbi:hypothetical protein L9F63_021751, partial [Diploptera punctata]